MDLLWIYSVFCLILSVTQPFAKSQSITGSSYECFRTVVQPLSRQCAPDFAIDGKFCIRTEIKYSKIQPVPDCLPGYTFSNENNRCYKMTNTSICVPPSCPHGYKLNGSLCIVDSSVSSVSSFSCVATCQCPDGFSFDGVFCAKNNFKCPLDYPFSYYSCGSISASTTCCLPLNIQQSFEYRLEIYRVNATIPRPPTTNVPPSKPLQCSAGSVLIGNCCRGFIDVQDIQPPTEICTNGYYLENHQCLKQLTIVTKQPPEIQCPPGTIKSDCECLMEKCCNGTESTTTTQPPTSPTSPTSRPTSPPGHTSTSNTTTSQTNYTCWGGSCYINNVNSVNVATNVNTNSATNVLVHLTEGGKTSIQIHNETTNQQGTTPGTTPGTSLATTPGTSLATTPGTMPGTTPGTTPGTESPSTSTVGHPCCVIVSPRQCKETDNGTWHCFHRKKRVCLPICSRWSIIYLQPRQIIYQPPIMIVPPVRVPPMYCRGCSHRRLHDCSGCYSRGFCPQYCSNYECSSADCHLISQETFCHDYPGEMCSHDYGCFEEYCRN